MPPHRPGARLQVLTYPGIGNLTGRPGTPEDIVQTLSPVARDSAVRTAIRILNGLAFDSRMQDDQRALLDRMEPSLKPAYAAFLADNADAIVRPFHPSQQLVMLHAASRFCTGNVGGLSPEETQQRFIRVCLQINDLLIKRPPDTRNITSLYLFSEQGPHWDLVNNSQPLHSLGRLRFLLLNMAARDDEYGKAAQRLRDRFPQYVGLPFETVFHLTAFLIFWWHLHAQHLGTNPDACLIDRRTWLARSTLTNEEMDRFLDRLCTSPDQLVRRFDEIGTGMSFQELMPFRQRPLFRIDDHGIGFISPQFVTEKGGVDLFWLLTNETPGVRESQLWTDDFGKLLEGYVQDILTNLGLDGVGGSYEHSIDWRVNEEASGEIDGLIHSGGVLVLIETKGSLVSQTVLSRGDETAVREEIERKFVVGTDRSPKGLRQLARAIDWLARERKHGRSVRGIDLVGIQWIIPVLVVADRSLRFPPLAGWFNQRFGSLLRKSWGRIGPLVLCSLEDLEAMEQQAADANGTIVSTLVEYGEEFSKAERPVSEAISGRKPHRRLHTQVDAWIHELQARQILPLE